MGTSVGGIKTTWVKLRVTVVVHQCFQKGLKFLPILFANFSIIRGIYASEYRIYNEMRRGYPQQASWLLTLGRDYAVNRCEWCGGIYNVYRHGVSPYKMEILT